jgi:hypothetical protein
MARCPGRGGAGVAAHAGLTPSRRRLEECCHEGLVGDAPASYSTKPRSCGGVVACRSRREISTSGRRSLPLLSGRSAVPRRGAVAVPRELPPSHLCETAQPCLSWRLELKLCCVMKEETGSECVRVCVRVCVCVCVCVCCVCARVQGVAPRRDRGATSECERARVVRAWPDTRRYGLAIDDDVASLKM